jgi:hypothetical protein
MQDDISGYWCMNRVTDRCGIRSWIRGRFNFRYHFADDSMAWWISLGFQLIDPVYQTSLLLGRNPLGCLLSLDLSLAPLSRSHNIDQGMPNAAAATFTNPI